MKKIKILIPIFILVLITAIWIWQKNIFSKEVLKLEILGPNEIILGQEVEYIVKYKNNGNFRLEEPILVFEPPKNALQDGKIFERQILEKEILGEAIYPGEEKTVTFRIRLLGKEGEKKIAKAALSYRPKNLKARFESSTTFTTIIRSVPITFEFDLPSKADANKDFVFRINYFSNLDLVLTDLRIQVEYPSGFEFIESTPKSLEKIEWIIPVLNKSQGGRIEIKGKILGEVGEVKIFKAKLGIWREGEFIWLKETEKGVELTKLSIFLRQEINGNPQYVAQAGDWLHYKIYFKNIGDEELTDLSLINKLEGDAFDFQTIKSDLGQTTPGSDSVIFDWRKVSKLRYLAPTEEGSVDFWIKLKEDLSHVRDPVLKNKVFIGQLKEEFLTKIASKLEISQKGYFDDEFFGNSGPLPPKVGEITTYTIVWEIKNHHSNVKNVKIKAILPTQSSLSGKIFPEEMASKFSFDQESREIVWSIGDLEKGTKIILAFQISFSPNELQRGKTPEIVGEVKISGEDVLTETEILATSPSLNTASIEDAILIPKKGIVQ